MAPGGKLARVRLKEEAGEIRSANTNGIRLSNFATGNAITGNQISNNQCGIQTDSSSSVDQNYVTDNTFAGNTQDYCSI